MTSPDLDDSARARPFSPPAKVSYAGAGVDIDAGERAVALMRSAVETATRPEVVGGLGGFAGLFRFDVNRYRRPLLVTSTDGVGTKVAIAQMLDKHDTIGRDLVAMVVDDIAVCGAEPLFLTDYIACGRVVPERVATIVVGIAAGCREAGCALIGGETAEHPGLLGPEEYDLAGAATGVVEESALLGPHRVREGDAVIALASSGLHSNGYSLVRHVFFDLAGWSVERHLPELGHTLGEELLTPTTIYSPHCVELASAVDVHAFAHITGGGLAGNLDRVLPSGLGARIDRSTWAPPVIFQLVAEVGGVDQAELERTLNMGVGMVAVVAEADAERAVEVLASRGVTAWIAGQVFPSEQGTILVGRHASSR
ncbi:MAG: phosphoribosylformylglycinamidine cyclo-ligase [Acidothermus sp.]|nr:phosphoribosylformylglycinamidine cyclo-ligase [Acidothermus sp.]